MGTGIGPRNAGAESERLGISGEEDVEGPLVDSWRIAHLESWGEKGWIDRCMKKETGEQTEAKIKQEVAQMIKSAKSEFHPSPHTNTHTHTNKFNIGITEGFIMLQIVTVILVCTNKEAPVTISNVT